MHNRSHEETAWDLDLPSRISATTTALTRCCRCPNSRPPGPVTLWVLGEHRLVCGDATQADVVAKLLGAVKPLLMVTDPPYGISLDTEWRGRAGLNGAPVHRTQRNEGSRSVALAGVKPQYEPAVRQAAVPQRRAYLYHAICPSLPLGYAITDVTGGIR
jgi:hypothetical protein